MFELDVQWEHLYLNNNESCLDCRIQNKKKEFAKDAYSIMFFLEPADVKNTGFLTYDYFDEDRDEDQWLYLPALRKTKRIGGSEQNGSFMGSDFNYSDMNEINLSDYTYNLMKEPEVDGVKTWQVEVTPKSNKIADGDGYFKSVLFVRQDNDVVIRSIKWVYKKQNRRKYMKVNKLEKIDDIWVATESQMVTKNRKSTVHSTILRSTNIKFNQDLSDSFFTKRQLEKGL